MHITGLHLLLTYRCTYECDHCFVWSSPHANGTMTLAWAKDAVRQAAELGSVNSICIEGGEPFLFYPIMIEIARYARELGLGVSIVTNGYFGTSVEDALEWLKPLQDIGVSPMFISDDSYHSGITASKTPADYAVEAAQQLGINSIPICIDPPTSVEDERNPGEAIMGGGVRFRGRAVDKLQDDSLPKRNWDCFNVCLDEDFDQVKRLHLDAYGNLYPCQGVVVGNLKRNSLAEVVQRYDPQTHPIIAPIHEGGPAELVRKYNLPLHGQYLDACHLCYLARKMLLKKYPEYLAPAQVYGV
ncbi:MAG: radical SAM protein [Candidatus Electryoneaceae bacterium]|nr:radical SAM protein [Candidatus Electryoneaceae bacterium]